MPAYRCSNGHVFQSAREPLECPREGCESRVFVAVGADGGGIYPSAGTGTVSMYPSTARPSGIALFSVFYWIGVFLSLVGFVIALGFISESSDFDIVTYYLFTFLGFPFSVTAGVLALIKLHKAWQIVQPLRQEDLHYANMPTPGSAIGLLFVPFFNFYWMFVACVGLANRMNRYLSLRGIQVEPMKTGLATAMCVLALLFWIPLVSLVFIILFYLFILDVNRAANALLATEG